MTSEVSELDESCVLGNVYFFFKLNVLFLYIIHVYILCTSTSPGRWCNSQVIQKYKEFHQLLSYFHPSAKVYLQFWLLSMVKYTVLTDWLLDRFRYRGVAVSPSNIGTTGSKFPNKISVVNFMGINRTSPWGPMKKHHHHHHQLRFLVQICPNRMNFSRVFCSRPSTGNVPVGAQNLKDCPTPRSAWKKIWGSFPQRFFQLLRNDYYKNEKKM